MVSVVLFEDHTWRHLNPLATSQPAFEQRCGLFNTRERLELERTAGVLLCRSELEPLLPEGPWDVGPRSLIGAGDPDVGPTRLWLAGRLAPSVPLVRALLGLPSATPSFAWCDEDGLLAARLTATQSSATARGWLAWRQARSGDWDGPRFGEDPLTLEPAAGQRLVFPSGTDGAATTGLAAALAAAGGGESPALRRIWDIVPGTAAALAEDLRGALTAGGWQRRPYGLFAVAGRISPWASRSVLIRRSAADLGPGAWLLGDDLWCADGVEAAPGCVIDTRVGPVILDHGCQLAPHTLIEGPLYLGPGCRVKAGARLYGQSSFGIGNRLAGEIGESTFGDFANKQHEGFIGHAVLGSWTNLGAMTTCSDLKNNYGPVRVDLGDGEQDTGQRFVGLLAGDHVKTAIGTMFNTGTCVGFASNIFGAGMPPKQVPAFSWGGAKGAPAYAVEQAVATAGVVMSRRDCELLPAHRALFEAISGGA